MDHQLMPLTIGGVLKTGPNVFLGQIGKVLQKLIIRHAGREVL